MTTGIIAKHGAWTGHCLGPDARKNPDGYYENKRIKREAEKRTRPGRVGKIHPAWSDWPDFVHSVLADEGYAGGPWVVKHFAAFWRSWDLLDPMWVLPRRSTEAIMRSTRRAGFWRWADDEELFRIVEMHQEALDNIRDNRFASEVFYDDVVDGDRSSLKNAIENVGLHYDDDLSANFINPGYRNF